MTKNPNNNKNQITNQEKIKLLFHEGQEIFPYDPVLNFMLSTFLVQETINILLEVPMNTYYTTLEFEELRLNVPVIE